MNPRILFVDNFDSFTYNVAHLFIESGADVEVFLNDDARLKPELLREYDGLLLGPGPGNPEGAPGMMSMLDAAVQQKMPIFGVCLGLQAIGEYFGGTIVHAPAIMHGKTSVISHEQHPMFDGVPERFTATRYHSLCVDPKSLPKTLQATARSEDGVVQAVAHRELPIRGVQFHPESVLSEHGEQIARNFIGGLTGSVPRGTVGRR